jgi:molecular chaperone GrpE
MNDETKRPETPNEQGAPDPAAPVEQAAQAQGPDPQSPTSEELAAALQASRDQLLRAVAEADNTRKRAEREIADARVYAVASFARDLLSVADNLDRALEALTLERRASLGEAGSTLVDGVDITRRELQAALTRHGVKPVVIEPGDAFDPNLHQAAMRLPSEKPAGAIVEVLQPGWVIGDRVLRAATVAVSAGSGQADAPASPADEETSRRPGASVDTKV